MVVMPAKTEPGILHPFGRRFQPLGERDPAFGVAAVAQVVLRRGAIELLHTKGTGGGDGLVEVVLKIVDREEVARRHGQPVGLQHGEGFDRILIVAAEAFDLGIAELAEQFESVFPGSVVASGIELE